MNRISLQIECGKVRHFHVKPPNIVMTAGLTFLEYNLGVVTFFRHTSGMSTCFVDHSMPQIYFPIKKRWRNTCKQIYIVPAQGPCHCPLLVGGEAAEGFKWFQVFHGMSGVSQQAALGKSVANVAKRHVRTSGLSYASVVLIKAGCKKMEEN